MKVSNVVLGSLVVASVATAVQTSPVVAVGLGVLAAMTGSWAEADGGDSSVAAQCSVDTNLSTEWQAADQAYCALEQSRLDYNSKKKTYQTKFNEYVDACTLKDDLMPVKGEQACNQARQAATDAESAAVEAYGKATGCKEFVRSGSTCSGDKTVSGSFLEKYNAAVERARAADKRNKAQEYNSAMPEKFKA